MMKNILLSLLTYALLWAQGVNASEPFQLISQEEFSAVSTQLDTVVIDVRTPREYQAGHIPGAINLPHRDIISGKITLEQLNDKNLILYCHSGVRVGIVNDYLQKNPRLEREKIVHLKGDFRAWQARGKPIAKPK